uniref:NADH-ubiquinone oxidoreductase chain 1 n=1 Tax=Hormiphora cucumis TaxID=3279321 RepID=A0A649YDX1_9METZ|nr:NADH dehydrogenase subunit 1 [Beroe cucumis]QGL53123.1 NADH dehydrogenase subunit 1 [Beroe cucumis]
MSLVYYILLIIGVPFIIYFERRLLGVLQLRLGLFIYALNSFFIFIADFLKIISKYQVYIFSYNFVLLYIFCLIFTILSVISLFTISFNFSSNGYFYFQLILLIILCFIPFFFSIFIYFSNSIFSYIGNLRSVFLLLSYELSLNFSLIIILYESYSFFLYFHVYNLWILILVISILVLCFMSDSSRVPFDLIEGESELVSGFNTELALSLFLLIFFGEYMLLYVFIIFFSYLNSSLILSLFIFIYVRGLLVRYFFLHLIKLFWYNFLFILNWLFLFILIS